MADAPRANQYRVTQQPGTTEDNKYASESAATGENTTAEPIRRHKPSSIWDIAGFGDCLAQFCCCFCLWTSCDSNSDGCSDCDCSGCGDCDCGGCDC